MIDLNVIGIGADTSQIRTANKDLETFEKSADKASRGADGLGTSITSMAKGFIGVSAGIAALSKLTSTLDEYTKYTAILKNATNGQGEFNQALSDVRRIANTAQTDIAGLATVYARFSGALKEFGATQAQVTTLTETIALALKANGASAAESSAAMLQLSQAFGAGRLSGDEFRSMAEAAPNLMRALAASIGVPTGALKDMAAQGQLTNDVLLKAFTDPKLTASLRAQASEITTFSGAWQQLKNEISASFAALESATGFFKSLAISTAQLAQGIGIIRGFFQGDSVKQLNEELRKATNMLAAFDNGNAFDKAVMGGKSRRDEMLADVIRLQKELSALTKKSPANPASLQTPANIDEKWMDAQLKAYKQQIDEQKKTREKAAKDAAEKERELALAESAWKQKQANDYQEKLREAWEKNEKEKAKLAEKLADEKQKADEKRLDDLSKQAQRNYEAAQKEAEKQAEVLKREQDKINDALGRGLTDALMRGFESGKSFAQNFIDTLKNMFGTLVLRPAIEWVLSGSGITGALAGLGGMFSGNASASTSGTSQGVSLVKGILNGFDGLNNSFQSSIESLGAYLAESNFSSIKSLGGMIGQYSSTIAQVAPYAGAALKLLQGDFKGAAFTGAGTAIGSFVGGPIGGAIGGALGSVFGGLFGGKEPPMVGSQAKGTFSSGQFTGTSSVYGKKDIGAQSLLNDLNKAFATSLGTLLGKFGLNDSVSATSIFRKRTNSRGFFGANFEGGSFYSQLSKNESFETFANKVLGPELVKAIQMSKLPESIKNLFDEISDKSQVQNMIAAAQSLNDAQDELAKRFGLTVEIAADIAKQSGLTGDALAQLVVSLSGAALATQKTSVTLIKERDALKDLIGSLPTSVDAFDKILKSINTSTADGREQFAELFKLRERFATYTGSFDSVVSNVESAIYGMLSPSEKLALDQSNLAKAFGELNLSVPGSIQELIDLGKSIDYTKESGLDLALAFPALVEMFGKTQDAVNSLTADLSANYFSTLADYKSAQVSDTPAMYIKNQATINAELLAQIQAMKQDSEQQKAVLLTVAEYTFKQSRVLEDWDVNGMPAERTV